VYEITTILQTAVASSPRLISIYHRRHEQQANGRNAGRYPDHRKRRESARGAARFSANASMARDGRSVRGPESVPHALHLNAASMSRRARDWAWARQGLTPAQRLVLLALAEHADDCGERCFPSLGLLERMTELSRRGITKALNALEGAFIERDRGGPGRATRYRLLLSAQADNEPGSQSGEHRSLSECREPDPLGNPVPQPRELSALAQPKEPGSLGNSVPADRELSSAGREHSSTLVGNTVPPNRHKNRHITVKEPEKSGDADAHTQTRSANPGKKPTRIPPDWRPGDRVFDWSAKQGMTRQWVQAQIDEFIVYWSDTGERRKSWDATFINRLRTLQVNEPRGQDHERERRLADKDYGSGATPLDEIPWIRPAAVR